MNHALLSTGLLINCTILIGIGLVGCGAVTPPPSDNTSSIQEVEPNDTFAEAQVVPLVVGSTVNIDGTLEGGNDIDVFSIGTFAAGQTLSATLSGDPSVNPDNVQFGFFDLNQDVAILDDNAVTAADQTVSFIVHEPGEYFVAVAEFNQSASSSLSYTLQVTAGSGTVPTPPKQIVFLNYNGISSVTIGGMSFTDVLPFSALKGGFDPTSIAKQTTGDVQTDYAPYNMLILSSYDTDEPSVPHSTVYITASRDPQLYGLSSGVDWYNEDPTDDAIIFAGALTGQGLSEIQFVDALANIVAHEMGHLSGLAHTLDHTEIMDQVTPLNDLDQPQTFHTAPLAEFPIGEEDTPQLLQFALGLLQPL